MRRWVLILFCSLEKVYNIFLPLIQKMVNKDSAADILDKYSRKLQKELDVPSEKSYSKEYTRFREEMVRSLSGYERWAKSLGNFVKINISQKDRIKVQKNLDDAHLDVSASQAVTLSLMSLLSVFFLTILASAAIYFIKYPQGFAEMTFSEVSDLFLFGFLGVTASMFIFYYAYTMPRRLANSWRLQASAQMVPAILYVVVYMKHTSNLERAIEF